MLGIKDKNFKRHMAISLDDLVPEDNFYRQVEQCLDLQFVRELVHGYCQLNFTHDEPSSNSTIICNSGQIQPPMTAVTSRHS